MNGVKREGVIMIPETDNLRMRSKRFMEARNLDYRVFYLPIDISQKVPVLVTEMSKEEQRLYEKTVGCKLAEKVCVFT